MTSTSAALRASISAALSEASVPRDAWDARAAVLRLDAVLASRLFEVVVVAVVDAPSPPPSWTRVSRRGRATRREKIRDERESQPPRDDRGVDGCNSGARLRHGHLSQTLVSSLLRRGEPLQRPRARQLRRPSARTRVRYPSPSISVRLRRRLGVGPRGRPGRWPGAGPCAGPGAGPGRRPRSASATLPAHLRDGVHDVPRASFAVRSPSA